MQGFPSSLAISVLALASVPVAGVRPAGGSPAVLQKVIDCRAIEDDKARLGCFDTSVSQLAAANSRGDVAVVDREEMKRTRRSLFGFTLPSLAIFGGGKDDKGRPREDEEIKEITAKAASVGYNAEGFFVITLEDGARWSQTEAMSFGRNPKPGSTIVIKRGAIGSYKMNWDGGPSVKARRTG